MWKRRNNGDVMKLNPTGIKSIEIGSSPSIPVWKTTALRTEQRALCFHMQKTKHQASEASFCSCRSLPVSLLEGPIKIEKGWSWCFSVTNSYILFILISLGIKTIQLVRGKRRKGTSGCHLLRSWGQPVNRALNIAISSQEHLSTVGLWVTEPCVQVAWPECHEVPSHASLSTNLNVHSLSASHKAQNPPVIKSK